MSSSEANPHSLVGKLLTRALCLGLCLVYFFNNVAFAHKPEANFWEQRREAVQAQGRHSEHSRDVPSPYEGEGEGKTILAGLPASLQGTDPTQILKGLPLPQSSFPQAVSGNPAVSRFLDSHFRGNDGLASLLQSLPALYGSVRNINRPNMEHRSSNIDVRSTKSDAPPLVIHIQDVHMNPEAQQNIGKTVQELINSGQVDLVALEGAFEPIDLTAFRNFPHQDTIHKVADYLLRENKISGPIHAFLTCPQENEGSKSRHPGEGRDPGKRNKGLDSGFRRNDDTLPSIIGIDDPAHYQANVEAYRNSAPHLKAYRDRLAGLEGKLEQEKSRILNPELLSFDQQVQAYRQGKLKVGEHVRFLVSLSPVEGEGRVRGKAVPSSLSTFLQALDLEEHLDFSQVESQRTQLLSQLVKKLTKPQTSELLNYSVAYRLGQIRHIQFYQYLQDLCRRSGVPLRQYPAMETYIQYVLLSDKLNSEQLIRDLQKMEEEGYRSLVKTDQEKKLIAESKHLYLTGKLLDFSLTPQEWREYRILTSPHPKLGEGISSKEFPPFSLPGRRGGDEGFDLTPFESFYQEAEARDQAMVKNLLKSIRTSDREHRTSPLDVRSSMHNAPNVIVLVTGGFHSHGMDEKLQEAGFTTISFVPKITHVDTDSGSKYLSVFTQEKTPLEKLFQGEKLFMSPPPISDRMEAQVLTVVAHQHGVGKQVPPIFQTDIGLIGLPPDLAPRTRIINQDTGSLDMRFGPVDVTTTFDPNNGIEKATFKKMGIGVTIPQAVEQRISSWWKDKELWLTLAALVLFIAMMVHGYAYGPAVAGSMMAGAIFLDPSLEWFRRLEPWQKERLLKGDPNHNGFYFNGMQLKGQAATGIWGMIYAWPVFLRQDPGAVWWHADRYDFFNHLLNYEFSKEAASWAESFRASIRSIMESDGSPREKTIHLMAHLCSIALADAAWPYGPGLTANLGELAEALSGIGRHGMPAAIDSSVIFNLFGDPRLVRHSRWPIQSDQLLVYQDDPINKQLALQTWEKYHYYRNHPLPSDSNIRSHLSSEENRISEAMWRNPRFLHMPVVLKGRSAEDSPMAVGRMTNISQPTLVFLMMSALDVKAGQNVGDVGFGSGWVTNILADLAGPGGRVTAVDVDPALLENARYFSDALGHQNTQFVIADAKKESLANAPFDRLLVSAAAQSREEINHFLSQLKVGGRLVIPYEYATWLYIKDSEETIRKVKVIDSSFQTLETLPHLSAPAGQSSPPGTLLHHGLPFHILMRWRDAYKNFPLTKDDFQQTWELRLRLSSDSMERGAMSRLLRERYLEQNVLTEEKARMLDAYSGMSFPSWVDKVVEYGKAALPALVSALRDEKPKMRILAAKALEKLGPIAAEAIPELISTFKRESSAEVSVAAAEALLSVGRDVALNDQFVRWLRLHIRLYRNPGQQPSPPFQRLDLEDLTAALIKESVMPRIIRIMSLIAHMNIEGTDIRPALSPFLLRFDRGIRSEARVVLELQGQPIREVAPSEVLKQGSSIVNVGIVDPLKQVTVLLEEGSRHPDANVIAFNTDNMHVEQRRNGKWFYAKSGYMYLNGEVVFVRFQQPVQLHCVIDSTKEIENSEIPVDTNELIEKYLKTKDIVTMILRDAGVPVPRSLFLAAVDDTKKPTSHFDRVAWARRNKDHDFRRVTSFDDLRRMLIQFLDEPGEKGVKEAVLKPSSGSQGDDIFFYNRENIELALIYALRILSEGDVVVVQERVTPPSLKKDQNEQDWNVGGYISWDEVNHPIVGKTKLVRVDPKGRGRAVNISQSAVVMTADELKNGLGYTQQEFDEQDRKIDEVTKAAFLAVQRVAEEEVAMVVGTTRGEDGNQITEAGPMVDMPDFGRADVMVRKDRSPVIVELNGARSGGVYDQVKHEARFGESSVAREQILCPFFRRMIWKGRKYKENLPAEPQPPASSAESSGPPPVNSLLGLYAEARGWPHPERWMRVGYVLEIGIFLGATWLFHYMGWGQGSVFTAGTLPVTVFSLVALGFFMFYALIHVWVGTLSVGGARGQPIPKLALRFIPHFVGFWPYLLPTLWFNPYAFIIAGLFHIGLDEFRNYLKHASAHTGVAPKLSVRHRTLSQEDENKVGFLNLQKGYEIFDREPDASQNGTQGTGFNRFGAVNRNSGPSAQVNRVPEDGMPPRLTEQNKTSFLKSANNAGPGNLGQVGHKLGSDIFNQNVTFPEGFGVFSNRPKVQSYGFLNVLHHFTDRFPLGSTTGKFRNIHGVPATGFFLDNNLIFHSYFLYHRFSEESINSSSLRKLSFGLAASILIVMVVHGMMDREAASNLTLAMTIPAWIRVPDWMKKAWSGISSRLKQKQKGTGSTDRLSHPAPPPAPSAHSEPPAPELTDEILADRAQFFEKILIPNIKRYAELIAQARELAYQENSLERLTATLAKASKIVDLMATYRDVPLYKYLVKQPIALNHFKEFDELWGDYLFNKIYVNYWFLKKGVVNSDFLQKTDVPERCEHLLKVFGEYEKYQTPFANSNSYTKFKKDAEQYLAERHPAKIAELKSGAGSKGDTFETTRPEGPSPAPGAESSGPESQRKPRVVYRKEGEDLTLNDPAIRQAWDQDVKEQLALFHLSTELSSLTQQYGLIFHFPQEALDRLFSLPEFAAIDFGRSGEKMTEEQLYNLGFITLNSAFPAPPPEDADQMLAFRDEIEFNVFCLAAARRRQISLPQIPGMAPIQREYFSLVAGVSHKERVGFPEISRKRHSGVRGLVVLRPEFKGLFSPEFFDNPRDFIESQKVIPNPTLFQDSPGQIGDVPPLPFDLPFTPGADIGKIRYWDLLNGQRVFAKRVDLLGVRIPEEEIEIRKKVQLEFERHNREHGTDFRTIDFIGIVYDQGGFYLLSLGIQGRSLADDELRENGEEIAQLQNILRKAGVADIQGPARDRDIFLVPGDKGSLHLVAMDFETHPHRIIPEAPPTSDVPQSGGSAAPPAPGSLHSYSGGKGDYEIQLTRIGRTSADPRRWRAMRSEDGKVTEFQVQEAPRSLEEARGTLSEETRKEAAHLYRNLVPELTDAEVERYLFESKRFHTVFLFSGRDLAGFYVYYVNAVNIQIIVVGKEYRGTGAVDVVFEDIIERLAGGDRNRLFSADIDRTGHGAAKGHVMGTVEEIKKHLGVRSKVNLQTEEHNPPAPDAESSGGVMEMFKRPFLLALEKFLPKTVFNKVASAYDWGVVLMIENIILGGLFYGGSYIITGHLSWTPEMVVTFWRIFFLLHIFNLFLQSGSSRSPPAWGTLFYAFLIASLNISLSLSPISFNSLLIHFLVNQISVVPNQNMRRRILSTNNVNKWGFLTPGMVMAASLLLVAMVHGYVNGSVFPAAMAAAGITIFSFNASPASIRKLIEAWFKERVPFKKWVPFEEIEKEIRSRGIAGGLTESQIEGNVSAARYAFLFDSDYTHIPMDSGPTIQKQWVKIPVRVRVQLTAGQCKLLEDIANLLKNAGENHIEVLERMRQDHRADFERILTVLNSAARGKLSPDLILVKSTLSRLINTETIPPPALGSRMFLREEELTNSLKRVRVIGTTGSFASVLADEISRLYDKEAHPQPLALVQPRGTDVIEAIERNQRKTTKKVQTPEGFTTEENDRIAITASLGNPAAREPLMELAKNKLDVFIVGLTEAGFVESETTRSLVEFLLRYYLHHRYDADLEYRDLTLINTDNVPHNGDALRNLCRTIVANKPQEWLDLIGQWGTRGEVKPSENLERDLEEFKAWLDGVFPNTMVDRIVVAEAGSSHTHKITEEPPKIMLVVDGTKLSARVRDLIGHLPGGIVAESAQEVEWYHANKLRVLNAIHTAMVYVAALAGHPLTRDAINDKTIEAYLDRLFEDVILPSLLNDPRLNTQPGYENFLREYYSEWKERLRAPEPLDHYNSVIANMWTDKVGPRLAPSIEAMWPALAAQARTPATEQKLNLTAFVAASALRYLTPVGKNATNEYIGQADAPFRKDIEYKKGFSLKGDHYDIAASPRDKELVLQKLDGFLGEKTKEADVRKGIATILQSLSFPEDEKFVKRVADQYVRLALNREPASKVLEGILMGSSSDVSPEIVGEAVSADEAIQITRKLLDERRIYWIATPRLDQWQTKNFGVIPIAEEVAKQIINVEEILKRVRLSLNRDNLQGAKSFDLLIVDHVYGKQRREKTLIIVPHAENEIRDRPAAPPQARPPASGQPGAGSSGGAPLIRGWSENFNEPKHIGRGGVPVVSIEMKDKTKEHRFGVVAVRTDGNIIVQVHVKTLMRDIRSQAIEIHGAAQIEVNYDENPEKPEDPHQKPEDTYLRVVPINQEGETQENKTLIFDVNAHHKPHQGKFRVLSGTENPLRSYSPFPPPEQLRDRALTLPSTHEDWQGWSEEVVERAIAPWWESYEPFEPKSYLDAHEHKKPSHKYYRIIGIIGIALGWVASSGLTGWFLGPIFPLDPFFSPWILMILTPLLSTTSGWAFLQLKNNKAPRLEPLAPFLFILSLPAVIGGDLMHFLYNNTLGRWAPLTMDKKGKKPKKGKGIDAQEFSEEIVPLPRGDYSPKFFGVARPGHQRKFQHWVGMTRQNLPEEFLRKRISNLYVHLSEETKRVLENKGAKYKTIGDLMDDVSRGVQRVKRKIELVKAFTYLYSKFLASGKWKVLEGKVIGLDFSREDINRLMKYISEELKKRVDSVIENKRLETIGDLLKTKKAGFNPDIQDALEDAFGKLAAATGQFIPVEDFLALEALPEAKRERPHYKELVEKLGPQSPLSSDSPIEELLRPLEMSESPYDKKFGTRMLRALRRAGKKMVGDVQSLIETEEIHPNYIVWIREELQQRGLTPGGSNSGLRETPLQESFLAVGSYVNAIRMLLPAVKRNADNVQAQVLESIQGHLTIILTGFNGVKETSDEGKALTPKQWSRLRGILIKNINTIRQLLSSMKPLKKVDPEHFENVLNGLTEIEGKMKEVDKRVSRRPGPHHKSLWNASWKQRFFILLAHGLRRLHQMGLPIPKFGLIPELRGFPEMLEPEFGHPISVDFLGALTIQEGLMEWMPHWIQRWFALHELVHFQHPDWSETQVAATDHKTFRQAFEPRPEIRATMLVPSVMRTVMGRAKVVFSEVGGFVEVSPYRTDIPESLNQPLMNHLGIVMEKAGKIRDVASELTTASQKRAQTKVIEMLTNIAVINGQVGEIRSQMNGVKGPAKQALGNLLKRISEQSFQIEHLLADVAAAGTAETPLEKPEVIRAAGIAHEISTAFDSYYARRTAITERSTARFGRREWTGWLSHAKELIVLYRQFIDTTIMTVKEILGERLGDINLWKNEIREVYLGLIKDRYDRDLAKTFFYSVMRKIFASERSVISVEYSDDGIQPGAPANEVPYRTYPAGTDWKDILKDVFDNIGFMVKFEDLERDVDLSAHRLEEAMKSLKDVKTIEFLKPVFRRNKGAYIFGRVRSEKGDTILPVVLALINTESGIKVHAVLTNGTHVSNIFTYTRFSFHVALGFYYREIIDFLQTLAPKRDRATILSNIGFIHPAKVQVVQDLRRHIRDSHEGFEPAEGPRGRVMEVITFRSFPYVLKIARDYSNKETFISRSHTMSQYQKVHEIDRVGRLPDSMYMRNITLSKSLFPKALLEQLIQNAPSSIQVVGEEVVLKDVYFQRKVRPLFVYLNDPSVPSQAKKDAIIELGYCIKDMAAGGILPGDLLLKNFGVTSTGRIVYYDFDDVEDLVDIKDSKIMSAISQIRTDLIPPEFYDVFVQYHADFLEAGNWQDIQRQLRDGQLPDIFPYPPETWLNAPPTPSQATTLSSGRKGEGYGNETWTETIQLEGLNFLRLRVRHPKAKILVIEPIKLLGLDLLMAFRDQFRDTDFDILEPESELVEKEGQLKPGIRGKLKELVKNGRYDYVVGYVNELYDEEFFRLAKLKGLILFSTAIHNIDLQAATAYDTVVTNAPGPTTTPVAEQLAGFVLDILYSHSVHQDIHPQSHSLTEVPDASAASAKAQIIWYMFLRKVLKFDDSFSFGESERYVRTGVGDKATVYHGKIGQSEGDESKASVGIIGLNETGLQLAELAMAYEVATIYVLQEEIDESKMKRLEGLRKAVLAASSTKGLSIEIKPVSRGDLSRSAKYILRTVEEPLSLSNAGLDSVVDAKTLFVQNQPASLVGIPVGVFGLGRIGEAAAQRLITMGADVLICQRGSERPEYQDKLQRLKRLAVERSRTSGHPVTVEFVDKKQFFKRSRIIALTASLTPETQSWVNQDALTALGSGTPDGPLGIASITKGLIDEEALLHYAQTHPQVGVRLDVVRGNEEDNLPQRSFPSNVRVAGHTAAAVLESRRAKIKMVLENLRKIMDGETPKNKLNDPAPIRPSASFVFFGPALDWPGIVLITAYLIWWAYRHDVKGVRRVVDRFNEFVLNLFRLGSRKKQIQASFNVPDEILLAGEVLAGAESPAPHTRQAVVASAQYDRDYTLSQQVEENLEHRPLSLGVGEMMLGQNFEEAVKSVGKKDLKPIQELITQGSELADKELAFAVRPEDEKSIRQILQNTTQKLRLFSNPGTKQEYGDLLRDYPGRIRIIEHKGGRLTTGRALDLGAFVEDVLQEKDHSNLFVLIRVDMDLKEPRALLRFQGEAMSLAIINLVNSVATAAPFAANDLDKILEEARRIARDA